MTTEQNERFIDYVTEAPGYEKLKEVHRTIIYDRQADEIYLPATPMDMMMAVYDGGLMISKQGCSFLPISWLKKEHPEQQYELAEKNIRESIGLPVDGASRTEDSEVSK